VGKVIGFGPWLGFGAGDEFVRGKGSGGNGGQCHRGGQW
jgi:hypothetical protein